jgi:hypothetical protein
VFLECSLSVDSCYLGTVNGGDGECEQWLASQEAAGMMSHRQGNTILVLPLGNPLQTLLLEGEALEYASQSHREVFGL